VSGLRVLKPGPQSILQDAGRRGLQHLGVSPAGSLDGHAAAWANRLLDNPWGTPLLEMALGGVELLAEVDTWVALCGAQVSLSVDAQPQPLWQHYPCRA
jgi:allophanate hydrolase subunit 2